MRHCIIFPSFIVRLPINLYNAHNCGSLPAMYPTDATKRCFNLQSWLQIPDFNIPSWLQMDPLDFNIPSWLQMDPIDFNIPSWLQMDPLDFNIPSWLQMDPLTSIFHLDYRRIPDFNILSWLQMDPLTSMFHIDYRWIPSHIFFSSRYLSSSSGSRCFLFNHKDLNSGSVL